jgi:hypothetical protein
MIQYAFRYYSDYKLRRDQKVDGPTIAMIMAAILGASICLIILKRKHKTNQTEAKILANTRHQLDSNLTLQRIVMILRDEVNNRPIQDHLESWKMCQLPAFLEDIASQWEFRIVSIKGAYDTVGKEVVLCDESKLLWLNEESKRSNTYWHLFNRFAKAIQIEKARR